MKLNVGDKVGRLTVLDIAYRTVGKQTRIYCYCSCECGNKKWIRMDSIGCRGGKARSCGCYRENVNFNKGTHKKSNSSTYNTWISMKQRCLNSQAPNYELYGGRGIKICDRWIHSFENFLEDMGEKPSEKHSIDRIDVNGNYEPSNCRWATNDEQQNNKRNSVKEMVNGNLYSFRELSCLYNIKESRIRNWRRRGLNIEERLNKLRK